MRINTPMQCETRAITTKNSDANLNAPTEEPFYLKRNYCYPWATCAILPPHNSFGKNNDDVIILDPVMIAMKRPYWYRSKIRLPGTE
jgi:hypothetical protein